MPRWPEGYQAGAWKRCPRCGGKKDHGAAACRGCTDYSKPLAGRKGTEHPAWRGGKRVDGDGYIKTYCPDHPFPRRGGYVFEHVRVMELHLGRKLGANESVHHKDGNKTNNDLANLEVLLRGEHSRLHRKQDTHLRNRDALGRFAGKEVSNASN